MALYMALCMAICVMAILIVIPVSTAAHTYLVGLIWRITLGLAPPHWFAFRASARMGGLAQSALPTSN